VIDADSTEIDADKPGDDADNPESPLDNVKPLLTARNPSLENLKSMLGILGAVPSIWRTARWSRGTSL
jgi:hypothetical protein